MARETYENWIPDEVAASVIQVADKGSAVELAARTEVMASDLKRVPRSGGFTVGTVAKGGIYSESTSTNDYVELIARKIGGIERIAVEDLTDTTIDPLAVKRVDAAYAMGKFFDNAALGTKVVANGTTVPFNSVYYTVTQADAAVGYTANANLKATAGALTYAKLVETISAVGAGDWGSDLVIIAHPTFRFETLGITGNNVPLIDNALTGGWEGRTLLGVPVLWSQGAKVSATATGASGSSTPGVAGTNGNPLLIVANRSLLIKGVANLPGVSNGAPGFSFQDVNVGSGYITDEALMKAAMRRGFAVGNVNGVAVLERTS
jgi:hypothetical protein